MSSAVQPSPVTPTPFNHARLLATYPVDMFKAIEPFIATLTECKDRKTDLNHPVAINDRIFTIYTTLGHTRAAIQNALPSNMLHMGGEHIFFNSTQQKHQGDWIKGVFELVRDLENRIRDYFRNPSDPETLLKEIVSSDALSLARFFSEHQRFNLLTGEIASAVTTSQPALYHQDDTVRIAARFGMKPVTLP